MKVAAGIPVGRLSHRLTLERKVLTADGGGGAAVTWETVSGMWGAVEITGGTERTRADGISGEEDAIITIRYRDDIAPAMRFRNGAQVFEILSALEADGRRRYLRCKCQRRRL